MERLRRTLFALFRRRRKVTEPRPTEAEIIAARQIIREFMPLHSDRLKSEQFGLAMYRLGWRAHEQTAPIRVFALEPLTPETTGELGVWINPTGQYTAQGEITGDQEPRTEPVARPGSYFLAHYKEHMKTQHQPAVSPLRERHLPHVEPEEDDTDFRTPAFLR